MTGAEIFILGLIVFGLSARICGELYTKKISREKKQSLKARLDETDLSEQRKEELLEELRNVWEESSLWS